MAPRNEVPLGPGLFRCSLQSVKIVRTKKLAEPTTPGINVLLVSPRALPSLALGVMGMLLSSESTSVLNQWLAKKHS